MIDFLQNYWWLIIILIGIIIFFIWYYKKNGKENTLEEFKELAYKLMLTAERHLSDDSDKVDWVVKKLYILLPDPIKILVSTDDLEEWVKELDNEVIKFTEEHHLKN